MGEKQKFSPSLFVKRVIDIEILLLFFIMMTI